jgi:hypothetical protein
VAEWFVDRRGLCLCLDQCSVLNASLGWAWARAFADADADADVGLFRTARIMRGMERDEGVCLDEMYVTALWVFL